MNHHDPIVASIPSISRQLNRRGLSSIRPHSNIRVRLYFLLFIILNIEFTQQHLGVIYYDVVRFLLSSYVSLLFFVSCELIYLSQWRAIKHQMRGGDKYEILPSSVRLGPLMLLNIQSRERANFWLIVFSDQVKAVCWREWCLKLAFARSQTNRSS